MPVMIDNTVLVYVWTERGADDWLEVETVQGEGEDVTVRSFEVPDEEPSDVWGPIFSRVFDRLRLTLADPGDFTFERVELEADGGVFLVTIGCDFTEEG